MAIDESLKKIASDLRLFARENHRLPSYAELAKMLGFASKNAAYKIANKLVEAGLLQRDAGGRLKLGATGLPLLGYVQAGFPSPAEEELVDTLSIDDYLIRNPASSFLLKVSGDSMVDAGIMPEDIVIVERGRTPNNNDIVLAQVDRQWTLKYFNKKGKAVTLIAANKKYPPIHPQEELTIGGVVTAVIRKYK